MDYYLSVFQKATTPIEVLERPLLESSPSERESPERAVPAAANSQSDFIDVESPLIEQIEQITLENVRINESMSDATADFRQDKSSSEKVMDAGETVTGVIEEPASERKEAPALFIEFGGPADETPNIDTPAPEPDNATAFVIDFGSPMEKIVEVIRNDGNENKVENTAAGEHVSHEHTDLPESINHKAKPYILGAGDVGPPAATDSSDFVAPISTEN